MEQSIHLTAKLKSSFLLTLIFSYYNYHVEVEKLIRILSKAGKTFIANNCQQLEYFCNKEEKLLKIRMEETQKFLLVSRPCKIILPERLKLALAEPTNTKETQSVIRHLENGDDICFKIKSIKSGQVATYSVEEILSSASSIKLTFSSLFFPPDDMILQICLDEFDQKLKLHIFLYDFPTIKNKGAQVMHQRVQNFKIPSKGLYINLYFFEQFSFEALSNLKQLKIEGLINSTAIIYQIFTEFNMNIFRSLKSLQMKFSSDLQDETLESAICSILKQMCSLQKLKISINMFDFSILDSTPHLRVLKVASKHFSISKANIQNINKLQSIFWWCEDLDCKEQLKTLFDSLQNVRRLSIFELSGDIFKVFQKNTSLQYLELRFNFFMNKNVLQVVTSLSNLEECLLRVDIKKNYMLQGQIQSEEQEYQKNICLKSLKIRFEYTDKNSNFELIKNDIVKFISSFQSLSVLKINDSYDEFQVLMDIYQEIFPQLPKLSQFKITSNSFPKNIDRIQLALEGKSECLESLDIYKRSLNQNGFESLIKVLSKNKALHTLKLSVKSDNLTQQSLSQFFLVVKQHPNLRKLTLKLTLCLDKINNEEFVDQIVKNCQSLKELNLQILDENQLSEFVHQYLKKLQNQLIESIQTGLPNLDLLIL